MISRIVSSCIPGLVLLAVLGVPCSADAGEERLLAHPDMPGWPDMLRVDNGTILNVGDAVEILSASGDKAVAELILDEDIVDWSGYAGISFSFENCCDNALDVVIAVMSRGNEGRTQQSRQRMALPPGARMKLPFFFSNNNAGPYWGMRGIPVYHRIAQTLLSEPGANINLGQVTRILVEVSAENGARLRLNQVALFADDSPLAQLVPHPFIDAYGQFKHADWPGKVRDDDDLEAWRNREDTFLDANPFPLALDSFGGWMDGPALEATGWFRTERIGGHWWFVTPEGRLFLSLGVNCVHYGDATFVAGRDDWFESLPDPEGPFGACYGHVSGVHSMAAPIGGVGRSINHYRLNLKRKYGESYRQMARERAYRRLDAWGFNTIGNWSDGEVLAESPLPFIVTAGSGAAQPIAGSAGYWGKMKDVFDPAFAENTNEAIARAAARWRDDPRVVGFFVDNEMSWTGISAAALDSPPEQPARRALVAMLEERYGSVAAVAEAWECEANDWESLRLPRRPNAQSREDCDRFEYRFARRYFDTVADALRKHAPNHLYLGCRFTPVYCPPIVLQACAEVADVVSINLYSPAIPADRYHDLGKPVIFGEFHFGALDSGMFHPGLSVTESQADRAAQYHDYVESLARHPAAIGAHWFQYMDQPTTGRTLDGENYNIGLVSIADVPYRELTRSARDIHSRMYAIRYGSNN